MKVGIMTVLLLVGVLVCAASEEVETMQDANSTAHGTCLMQGNLNTIKKRSWPFHEDGTEVNVGEAVHQQVKLAATHAMNVRVALMQRLSRLKLTDATPAAVLVGAAFIFLILLGVVFGVLLIRSSDEAVVHSRNTRAEEGMAGDDTFSALPSAKLLTRRGMPPFLPTSARVPKSPSLSDRIAMKTTGSREAEFFGQHLCPELVVPEESECSLLVPPLLFQQIVAPPLSMRLLDSQLAHKSRASDAEMTIDDARGIPVFRVTISSSSASASGSDDASGNVHSIETQKRLVLSSAIGERILFAYVCEPAVCEDPSLLTIHHHSGARFGTLQKEEGDGQRGYRVKANSGWQLLFTGDWKLGALNATDEKNTLQAIVEPRLLDPIPRRSVRIGPGVDAGLVVLALMGIDMLKYGSRMIAR